MRRKSHAAKVAAKEDRKVLRRRILRVLNENGHNYEPNHVPVLDNATNRRVAALLRELKETR